MKLWLALAIVAQFIVAVQLTQSHSYKCGIKTNLKDKHTRVTTNEANDWPWMATLLRTSSRKLICGGSVVSVHHVLTAAHCVNNKKRNIMETEELLVYLGKHNLSASKGNIEWFHPYEILIHPDWESGGKHFDADIALLVAEVPIPFSSTISSVCLWTDLVEEDEFHVGTIVGWGSEDKSNTTADETPNKIQMQRVPSTRCYEDFHLIASIASSRTFCAAEVGQEEEDGPCTGYSGGGFFVEENGVWYIQGIVSASFLSKRNRCDVSKYSLFTKINEFISWINVRNVEYEVDLRCDFTLKSKAGQEEAISQCKALGLSVLQPSGKVALSGKKSLIAVEWLQIDDQDTVYLPNGIGSLFSTLRLLEIARSKLRFIERSNFENMDNVSALYIQFNPITYIPHDALSALTNLQEIGFTQCKLKKLHPNLFANNTYLRTLNISLNEIESLPADLFKQNVKLESFSADFNRIKFINDQVFAKLVNIQTLDLAQNFIQNISANAFRDLKNVLRINLDYNRLKSLHVDTISKNKALDTFRVQYNQIEEFPPGLFRNNVELTRLNLDNTRVNIIRGNLFENLVRLQGTGLIGMSLKQLPFDLFFPLTSLEIIVLHLNDLTELPKDLLIKNTNLLLFGASMNKIEVLHASFFRNNLKLRELHLLNNRIKSVPNGFLKNLTYVMNVDLSFNKINMLAADTFSDLVNLKLLRLNDNILQVLAQDLFVYNLNLRFLVLNSNEIEHLPNGLLRNNRNLALAGFADNNLANIETDFERNRQLQILEMSGNVCLRSNGVDLIDDNSQVEVVLKAIKKYCKHST